jgi:tetratricopeptide (TPR) repeat protein
LLEQARNHMAAGEFEPAERQLRVVLERNPHRLDARLDLAYVRQERGQAEEAHTLADRTYREAVDIGAAHLRMASAALLSRSPLVDQRAAEYYAGEAISIGNRLGSPDYTAAGHERLGELLVDRGEFELAAIQWSKAIDFYTESCPTGTQRVLGLLASLTREG